METICVYKSKVTESATQNSLWTDVHVYILISIYICAVSVTGVEWHTY